MTVCELRLGRWQDVLADIVECSSVVTDAPYSDRTHSGHDDGGSDRAHRRDINYDAFTEADIEEFAESWVPRCKGWFAALSDDVLCRHYRAAFESRGLTGFQPLPCVISGMTVRLAGDGPSSWAIYANVARPKALCKWGTLRGAYVGQPGERVHIGGKPLWLMRALIRDYTKPGDLIIDPFAGAATTLVAARIEGRDAIGAECDPETYEVGKARISAEYTPDLFSAIGA